MGTGSWPPTVSDESTGRPHESNRPDKWAYKAIFLKCEGEKPRRKKELILLAVSDPYHGRIGLKITLPGNSDLCLVHS